MRTIIKESMTTDIKSGQVSAHPRGFGFVETQEGERYFIPPPFMKRLLSEDQITFKAEPGKQAGEFQVGELLSVRRNSRMLLGELVAQGDRILFVADEPCFVIIEVPGAAATRGEVVAVHVPEAESAERTLRAELIEVLGPRGRQGFDEDYALIKYGLPRRATEGAEIESKSLDSDVPSRIGHGWADLRRIPFVTIDGASTRDIDDAVSAERCPAGFQVDVAIADVSAYVKPGSALAARAYERCTSVYLPGRTVPMLPEALSAELGSLKEGVPRLALVCRMVVGPKGEILVARFERAVITSQARLTYAAVYARMSEGRPVGDNPKVEHSLEVLEALYRVLAQARRDRGVLEFNDREPKLQTRENGELEIIWEERNDAHRMIEELMLLANQAAAEALLRRGTLGSIGIRRCLWRRTGRS